MIPEFPTYQQLFPIKPVNWLPALVDGIKLDGLDAKWQIDGPSLLTRLEALPLFQRACLELWARAFWEQTTGENAVALETWVMQIALSPIEIPK